MKDQTAPDGANAALAVNEKDMPNAKVTAHSLVGSNLNKSAKSIRAKFSKDKEAELLKIDAMGETQCAERLSNLPRPVRDQDIVGMIMALVRAGASEGAFARSFKDIKTYYTEYKDGWLNAARAYCEALVEAEREAKSNTKRDKNQLGKDGFWDLVAYGQAALKNTRHDPTLFRHGTEIARIATVQEEDTAAIQLVDREQFIAMFPARYVEVHGEGRTRDAAPPKDVISHIYHQPKLPLPYLGALTRVPTFGTEGQLQTDPGYNEDTQAFYVPPVGLTIDPVGGWRDEDARQRDLAKAKRLLVEEVLADFPFDGCSRDEIMDAFDGRSDSLMPASMMNAIGLILTPFVRQMISGPVPMHLATKPAAGTGATYFVEAVQIIATGKSQARAPLARSEDERRKALFTAIIAGESVVLYDNQNGVLDSQVLASALTATTFTDRVLGRTAERSVPINGTITMTSNNALLSEELQRRTSLIRLDAKMADPKARAGWRHASLHAWIEMNRAQLLWAVLTLIQNWVDQGCHGPKHCPAVASYIGWCYVVGGIIEAADPRWTTFQSNRDDIAAFASAGEEDEVTTLIAAWLETGVLKRPATEVAALMQDQGIDIEGVKTAPDGAVNVRSLGRTLATLLDRHFAVDGQEVRLTRETVDGKASWQLVPVGSADSNPSGSEPVKERGRASARVPVSYRGFPLGRSAEHGQKRPALTLLEGGATATSGQNPFGRK